MFTSLWLPSLKRQLRSRFFRRSHARRNRNRSHQLPSARALISRSAGETLEDRTLLTAFTVVNTNDSGAGSLRDAIEQANANTGADTISFAAALAGQTIVLSDEMWISDDLTITGLGADQLTIDANRQSRIFDITDNNSQALFSVVISGLSLVNGYESGSGGAIFNKENLTVLDCIFSKNEADSDGGSIWNAVDNVLNVERCIFSENKAHSGGGIYNINGKVTVSESTFVKNIADSRGSGIYSSSSLSEVSVTNSTFTGNVAEWYGGGIYSGAQILNISGCEFSENSAKGGGGIYNKKSSFSSEAAILNVHESRFLDNHTTGSGGGIYNQDAVLTITNSLFDQNSGYSGGGVYHSDNGEVFHDDGNVNVENSIFTGNSAKSGAGAYFSLADNDESVLISNSLFSENIASGSGGGLKSSGGGVSIENCTISNNSATGSGGGIFSGTSELSIFNTTISNNSATGLGGGIYSVFDPNLRIKNCTISDNQSSIAGGGIFISSRYSSIINCTISGNFAGADSYSSYAGNGGGIFYNQADAHDVPEILNCTITNNEALNEGGGVGVYIFNSVKIVNSIIAGNISSSGTQTFAESTSEITGYANIIQASIAGLMDPVLRDNGGPTKTHAILFNSAAIDAGNTGAAEDLELTTDQRGAGFSRFVNGSVDIGAFESGSLHFLVDAATDTDDGDYSVGNLSLREAIKLANESATADTITFDASLFDQTLMLRNELVISDDVTIIGHGAAHLTLSGDGTRRLIRIDDGDEETSISVELSEFTLTNGFANYTSGGAIHSLETLFISNVLFADNQASVLNGLLSSGSYGGAIYSSGDLTVTNSRFVRNSADWYGGAIYSTEGLLSITGCEFTENQTSQAGGAIVVQDGDLTVATSTFTENSSDNLGGAIYITQGVLTVSESVFKENRSGAGGAIYQQISSTFPPVFTELSITDSTFQGNTATSSGGAVYYASGLFTYGSFYTAYVEDCLFTENSASYGGALNIGGLNVLVTGSTFFKNTADNSGGGIRSNARNLTVQNSLFERNSVSHFGGGALYVEWELILINSTLSGNTARVAGGGIAFGNSGPAFEIVNSTLTGNAASQVGGAIYSFGVNSGLITNSIIAGNSAPSVPQVLTQYTRNNSIVQDSVEGLLDPVLRDNGGLTKTHALLPGSAAIDAGDDTALENVNLSILNRRETTFDSRGAGFDRYRGDAIDIGAFEVQSPFAQIEMTLVDSKTTTTGNGEIATLPDSLSWVDEWSGYWLEIWVSAPDAGVMSVALNLAYNTAITTAVAIEYGAAFTNNQTGTIDDASGLIAGLSAETSLTDVGDDQRVLFARIRFESTADDGIDLDLEGQTLIAESPEFTIFGSEVQLTGGAESEEVHGPSPETLVFANPYDLNDDGAINFRDLILFASVYNTDPQESNSDYSWFADLDQSNSVNFRDLISFASNYGKSKANQAHRHYPQNFTSNVSRHLSVEPTLLPQENPRPLEQPDAEAVFTGVKEYLAPDLTSEQNEKLAQVDIQVIDLANGVLSNTVRNTIYVDVNAASYGWFIDQTPADSSEFSPAGMYKLIPFPIGPTRGKVDLWTAILHEIGHVLGYDHEESGLMQETLAPGVRYLPDWFEETDAFFSTMDEESELLSF